MSFMFCHCYNLKELKGINKFNTSKVTDMSAMFQFCRELKCLDLSNFDTSNVLHMSYMFYECKKLEEIKGIDSFNTNNVIDIESMV